MRKKLLMLILFLSFSMIGCGSVKQSKVEEKKSDKEEAEVAKEDKVKDEVETEEAEEPFDPWKDYTLEIKDAVIEVVGNAGSLDEEMKGIEKLEEKYYTKPLEGEYSQTELNQISQWLYVVWDTEINNLWSRMSDELDPETKAAVLKEQRNWIALKEVGLAEALSDYEGGSIYSMLQSQELGKTTRTRVYYMANIFAKTKGQKFHLPELSICGRFVDNQDSNFAKNLLIIRPGLEGVYLGMMSIEDIGSVTGTVEERDGDWIFENTELGIKGKITLSWDGVTFTVLKAKKGDFKKGQEFSFPMIL